MLDEHISRRRLLTGAGVLAAAGGAALAARVLPARRLLNDLTGACGEPGPVPPAAGLPVSTGTFVWETVPDAVGYAVVLPPGLPRAHVPFAVMLPGRGGTAASAMSSTAFPDFLMQAVEAGTSPFGLAAVDGGESY